MNTPIQIKINLSEQLQDLLASKASKFGVPLTQYVKHVLMKDVEDVEYPIFKMSERTEKRAREAMEHIDEAVEVDDIHEFFKNL